MSLAEDTIRVRRQAIAATVRDSPDRAALLNNLGLSLRERFLTTGAMVDLEEAIQVTRQAIEATSENDPAQNSFSGNLGVLLGHKYSKSGSRADLEEAIQVTEKSLKKMPSDDPNRAGRLNNLAMILRYKYTSTSVLDTLKSVINLLLEAIEITPSDSPDYSMYLNNLATSLGEKHRRTGDIVDLEEANRVMREAINADPSDASHLNNLAVQLLYKYETTGLISDLGEAIDAMQKAIETTPIEHTNHAMFLNNLAILLRDRFLQTGIIADLERATQTARQVVDATPLNHPSRAGRLDNLAMQLRQKFSSTGEILDLDEAIRFGRLAIQSVNSDHIDQALMLHNLGASLRDRYLGFGAMGDLEEAIRLERDAIKLTPPESSGYVTLLHSLGIQLGDRYSRQRALRDLDGAVKVIQDALKGTSSDHPEYCFMLNNLGMSLGDKFESEGGMIDIERAILYTKEAIKKMSADNPSRATLLNNLATHLGNLYSATEKLTDLDEAIRVSHEAVQATPAQHPKKALCLTTLGRRLGERYKKSMKDSDLQDAIVNYQAALSQESSPAIVRIASGLELLSLRANSSDWEQAYKAADITIRLLNILTPRDLDHSDKQYMLSLLAGLGCNAAAVALNAGKGPIIALELLELGRGVLAASVDEMRADLLELKEQHPKLAERFLTLRDELSAPVQRYMSPTDETNTSLSSIQSRRRSDTNQKFDSLILEIQTHSGFEDFLMSPNKKELQFAANYGPIVVINVSQYRCDTILIERNQVRILKLPKLDIHEIQENVRHFRYTGIQVLEWLWHVAVSPILDALGFSQSPPDDTWPRIWWIPTGILSKLPLHAAGLHENENQTALDLVISSYSSSVKAIIYSRRRHIHTRTLPTPGLALLVAMDKTPELSSLPFAMEEVTMLRDLCQSMDLDSVEPKRFKQDILSHLRNCKIFHFAGHGHSNNSDPSQSYICLEDWKDDRLTIANLLEINLRENSPFLAYLSACGTGQIKDERFADESIHLISAFQLAGFRHVIGTLWEVHDERCLDVSRVVYTEMRDGNLSDAAVSRGLHLATRRLRDQWFRHLKKARNQSTGKSGNEKKGTEREIEIKLKNDKDQSGRGYPRDIDLSDDEETAPLDWVQYVHFGV